MAIVLLKDDNIKATVPIGTTLRQVATKSGASMEFGCRIGDCATCLATVKSGNEFLNEQNEKEKKALEIIGKEGDKNLRLMCQCSIEKEGEIVISYEVVC